MVGSGLKLEDLRACLASTAPVELLGMGLLRQQPHLVAAAPPILRPLLVEAVTEIIAYTGRCAAAMQQLANLTPIPLVTASILEFGL